MRRNLISLIGTWLVCALLVACGGEYAGNPGPSGQPTTSGQSAASDLTVHVVEAVQGTPDVLGAQVTVTDASDAEKTATTDGRGEAIFQSVPVGTVQVHVSATGFESTDFNWPLAADKKTQRMTAQLDRLVTSSMAVLATHSIAASANGMQLELEVDIAVLDGDGRAVSNLTGADFWLQSACFWEYPCLRTPSSQVWAEWKTTTDGRPLAFSLVVAPARRPYAAGVLVDQGRSPYDHGRLDPYRVDGIVDFLTKVTGADSVALAEARKLPPSPILQTHGGFASDGRILIDAARGLSSRVDGTSANDAAVTEMLAFMASQSLTQQPKLAVVGHGWDDLYSGSVDWVDRLVAESALRGTPITIIGAGFSAAQLAARSGGAHVALGYPSQSLGALRGLDAVLAGDLPFYRMRFKLETTTAGAFVPGSVINGAVGLRGPGRTVWGLVALRL